MNRNLNNMIEIALMAAILCILGPIAIPLGPIPFSLTPFIVFLTGYILGARNGSIAVIIYLLLGAVGLPVFSGYIGGLEKLTGVTGGYLIGFIFTAFLSGYAADRFKNEKKSMIYILMAMAGGLFLLYAFGTIWFMILTGTGLKASLSMCVIPFVPLDLCKAFLAYLVGNEVKKRIPGIRYKNA